MFLTAHFSDCPGLFPAKAGPTSLRQYLKLRRPNSALIKQNATCWIEMHFLQALPKAAKHSS
jgi:hypothetical protein